MCTATGAESMAEPGVPPLPWTLGQSSERLGSNQEVVQEAMHFQGPSPA